MWAQTGMLMMAAQFGLGVAIVLSSVVLLAAGVDGATIKRIRWPLYGLVAWGALFALQPIYYKCSDSPAALSMALLVSYVLTRYGRQVRGIIEGEYWWPPNRRCDDVEVTVYMRPMKIARPWWHKLRPWWALFGNDDDGYWGDDVWRSGRDKTLRLALLWWLRNPCHNLTWYVIGVADRERVVRGRWGAEIHKPGGGFLWMSTDVRLLGCWITLPFISYISPRVKTYVGWRPSGAFGIKLNLSAIGDIEVKA